MTAITTPPNVSLVPAPRCSCLSHGTPAAPGAALSARHARVTSDAGRFPRGPSPALAARQSLCGEGSYTKHGAGRAAPKPPPPPSVQARPRFLSNLHQDTHPGGRAHASGSRRPRPDAWASPRAPGSYLRPGTGTVTAALSACARPALVPRQAASDASALFAPCGEERGRSVEGPSLSPNTWVHPSSAGHGGDRKQRTAAGRQGLRAASVSGGRSSLSAEPEGLSSPQERQRPSPHLGLRRDRTEATILCTSLPRPRPQPVFLRRPHCAPLSLWGSVP